MTPVYCPQRNALVERFNRVLKQGAQAFSSVRNVPFRHAIRRLVTNFCATAPEFGKSPSELLRGWNIRTDADIRNPLLFDKGAEDCTPISMDQRRSIVQGKFKKWRYGHNPRNPKSPFRIGDIVQHQLPKDSFRKGQSPKSRPLSVRAQVGKWDYRLSDGQIWNARKLYRYRPAFHPEETISLEDLDNPPALPLRRSKRTNVGIPPRRFCPEDGK